MGEVHLVNDPLFLGPWGLPGGPMEKRKRSIVQHGRLKLPYKFH